MGNKSSIEIERVNNGYKVDVREPVASTSNDIYPDYTRESMVASSDGEVLQMVSMFMDGEKAPYNLNKDANGQ